MLLPMVVMAQDKRKFSIASFDADPFDMSAREKPYAKEDGSGSLFAIIKVTSNNPDDNLKEYQFNFGNLRHETKEHDGVLWVYVQKNAKTVTISRKNYVTINRFDLQTTIEAGKNYTMTLSSEAMPVYNRFLQFKVTPSGEHAIIKVKRERATDWELWGEVDATGSKAKNLEVGSYLYEIVASNYEKSEGKVNLTPGSTPLVENVVLTPNFGYLEIDDTYGIAGAEIYVNDRKIGNVPYKSNERWEARNDYRLMISKGEMYKTYNSTFSIEKGQTTKLSPKLEANFAETVIMVDNQAELYVNGEKKGNGKWTGPLKAGAYDVECRLPNHYTSKKQIIIKPDVAETFVIDAPRPITGSLSVNSNPLGATISIDGKECGVSPMTINDMIIGQHTITLTMRDYGTITQSFNIEENKSLDLELTMRNIAKVTIDSKPSGAKLYIDGKGKGVTPYTEEMESGDYDVKITMRKYQDYSKRIHFDSSQPNISINLARQYFAPSQFYIQPTAQFGSNSMIGGSIGGYISNVNIEGSYMIGIKESEMVYWNATEGNDKPCGYTYKASSMGARVGYGLIMNTRMRLTPQLGFGVVNVKAAETYNVTSSFDASKAYAVNATLGAKFEYALVDCIGVFAAPEYSFAIKKSNYFADIEPVSSTVKGFASGFNFRIGLSIFF